jgi:hypothetical protein
MRTVSTPSFDGFESAEAQGLASESQSSKPSAILHISSRRCGCPWPEAASRNPPRLRVRLEGIARARARCFQIAVNIGRQRDNQSGLLGLTILWVNDAIIAGRDGLAQAQVSARENAVQCIPAGAKNPLDAAMGRAGIMAPENQRCAHPI